MYSVEAHGVLALKDITSWTIDWASEETNVRRVWFSEKAHVVAPTDVTAAKACDG